MDKKFKKIRDNNPEKQCFEFAFSVTSTDEVLEMFKNFNQYYFEIREYIKLKKGDLVAFAPTPNGNVCHAGIIERLNKNIKNVIIRSTFFGLEGLYEHKLNDTPAQFGRYFRIYRRK